MVSLTFVITGHNWLLNIVRNKNEWLYSAWENQIQTAKLICADQLYVYCGNEPGSWQGSRFWLEMGFRGGYAVLARTDELCVFTSGH